MRLFIQEEKRRIESAITDLHLRLMRLSLIDEQAGEQQDITPYLLPFFSQAAEEFYRTHPANTFGMTKDNYRYLVELMNE